MRKLSIDCVHADSLNEYTLYLVKYPRKAIATYGHRWKSVIICKASGFHVSLLYLASFWCWSSSMLLNVYHQQNKHWRFVEIFLAAFLTFFVSGSSRLLVKQPRYVQVGVQCTLMWLNSWVIQHLTPAWYVLSVTLI